MKALAEQISDLDGVEVYGRVVGVRGLMVEVAGPIHAMSVGARVVIETGKPIPCEVVGFTGANALLMPFAALEGVRRGCRAVVMAAPAAVRPSLGWLGRVVNAMGEPIDGKGPLDAGSSPYPFRNLRRHGGADPARRLSRRIERGGRRGHTPAPAAGGFPRPGKEEATNLEQGYQRLEQILGRAETEN